jgi:uncharacterized membrane protein
LKAVSADIDNNHHQGEFMVLGGFGDLILASVLFVGGHFLLSSEAVRPKLAGVLGERGFAAVYSVLMIVLLVWMVMGFNRAPHVELWPTRGWMNFVPLVVMPLATFLLIGGVTQYNPTLVNAKFVEERDDPAPGILKVTRNPILWAIGLWAVAHLPPNGDVASLIFFGSLAFLALYGTERLEAKRRARDPNGFSRFASTTSNLPFAAIAEGRTTFALADIGWWRLALTAAVYVALFLAHPWIAGVGIH